MPNNQEELKLPFRTMEALLDLRSDLSTIKQYFGEETQANKSLEEMDELKSDIVKFLSMRKAGADVKLAHPSTASEMADNLVILFQLLLNPDLDQMVADWIYFKVPRTISRIGCNMYDESGILKK